MGTDDERPWGGPPPDPSARQWRHPSEMAAAAAGDQTFGHGQPPTPERPRRFSILSFTVGGMTGVAACLAAIGIASLALRNGGEAEQIEAAADSGETGSSNDGANDGTDTDVFDRSVLSGAVAVGSADGAVTTTIASSPSTTISSDSNATGAAPFAPIEPTVSTVSTVSTTVGSPTETTSAFAPIVSSPGIVAVYRHDNPSDVVGTGIVIDGLILTSAEACAGHTVFELEYDGERFDAQLIGIDRYSDLAVLAPMPTEPGDGSDSTTSAFDTMSPVNTLPPEIASEPGEPVTIVEATSTTRRSGADLTGEVVAVGERLTTRDGHYLIGALLTTVRRSENAVGGALVDIDGNTIGIVVNSDSYHAAAIPLHDALRIGHSLSERGRPADAWLGIEGADSNDGIVIDTVAKASPAEAAGLLPGDVLVSLDGNDLTDMGQLVALLRATDEAERVEFGVLRDGDEVIVAVEHSP